MFLLLSRHFSHRSHRLVLRSVCEQKVFVSVRVVYRVRDTRWTVFCVLCSTFYYVYVYAKQMKITKHLPLLLVRVLRACGASDIKVNAIFVLSA